MVKENEKLKKILFGRSAGRISGSCREYALVHDGQGRHSLSPRSLMLSGGGGGKQPVAGIFAEPNRESGL